MSSGFLDDLGRFYFDSKLGFDYKTLYDMSMARGFLDDDKALFGASVLRFQTKQETILDFITRAKQEIDPKTYLSDLKPGQKKLSQTQIEKIKIVETLGVALHKEIMRIQKEAYSPLLKEADLRLSEAERQLRDAKARKKEIEDKNNARWEQTKDEYHFYENWQFIDKDKRHLTYGENGYRGYGKDDERFDPVKYKIGKKAHEDNRKMLKKEGDAYKKIGEAEEFLRERTQERLSLQGLTYNQAMMAVMQQIRDFGGADEMKLSAEFETQIRSHRGRGDERDIRRFIRSAERFPKDWLKEMVDYRRRTGKKLKLMRYGDFMKGLEAHYAEGGNENKAYDVIRWNIWGLENFPSKDVDENIRNDQIAKDRFHSIFTHEMMHYMETIKPELGRAGNAYRVYRNQNDKPFSLGYANTDYRQIVQDNIKEAKKDPEKVKILQEAEAEKNAEWRSIQSNLSWSHSEVLTTGMETMVPGAFRMDAIQKDDEHRGFVLGCLALL